MPGLLLGMAAQVLYLLAGISGLPVFAASPVLPQGPLRLLGPTGGYLLTACMASGRQAAKGVLDRLATRTLQ